MNLRKSNMNIECWQVRIKKLKQNNKKQQQKKKNLKLPEKW